MELNLLNLKQSQIKEQWDNLSDPTYVRTILGMLDLFQVVDKLLIANQNIALHLSLYRADSSTLTDLRKILLIIRK